MKIIQTRAYIKLAYPSVDDQPGFVNRDVQDQGDAIFLDHAPKSEEQIKALWKKRRRNRRRMEQMPQGSL